MAVIRSRQASAAASTELAKLFKDKTSYAETSREDLAKLSLTALLGMCEGYRLRHKIDIVSALRGELDDQLASGLDVIGEADEINMQRSLANRMRKQDGLKLLPNQEVIASNTSLPDAKDFMARFRAELLRRQWQELTLAVVAVRYAMVDDKLLPLAYQNPDGSWFDDTTAASMGCESTRVFAPEFWICLTAGLGNKPELIGWDETQDTEWLIQVRTPKQSSNSKDFYCPEVYAALNDTSLKNKLAKVVTASNKSDALFDLGSRFGSKTRDHAPLAWTRKLLEAEKLRRAVKGLVTKGATHAVWRDWNEYKEGKAFLVAFEDDVSEQTYEYSGEDQFIINPRFVDFSEFFNDEGLCFYLLELNPSAK